jgi:long-chain acyl-CoA synthetase
LKTALKRLGNIFVQIYGQGETPMTATYLPRDDHVVDGSDEQKKPLLSAGIARTGIDVRIVDEDDREVRRGQRR